MRQSKSFTDKEALDQHLIELVASNERELLAAVDGRDHHALRRHAARRCTPPVPRSRSMKRPCARRSCRPSPIPNIALILLVHRRAGDLCRILVAGTDRAGSDRRHSGAARAFRYLRAADQLAGRGAAAARARRCLRWRRSSPRTAYWARARRCAMVLGAVMLIDSPLPEMRIHWQTAMALALPFSIITAMLVSLVVRARRNKVETGEQGMIGLVGSAVTALQPEGKVFVHGEYWDAVASRPVAAGAHVRVTAMTGLKLAVDPVPDQTGG